MTEGDAVMVNIHDRFERRREALGLGLTSADIERTLKGETDLRVMVERECRSAIALSALLLQGRAKTLSEHPQHGGIVRLGCELRALNGVTPK